MVIKLQSNKQTKHGYYIRGKYCSTADDFIKFDFLSMIVVEEYVSLLPNILSQVVFVDEQIMYIIGLTYTVRN
jgi:hypothetical protein